MGGRDDEELMKLCLEGRKEAWDEMYRRFTPLIRHIARSCEVPSHYVQDVLQETFVGLDASLKKGNYDPNRAKLSTFIGGIANRISRKYRGRFHGIYLENDGSAVDDIPAGEGSRHDRRLERLQILELVKDAVRSLKEVCREILWLRYREGLCYDEIAAILGGKTGALRQRALRCRNGLKEILEARGITL